ncbi:hypothetical protein [Streptomyces sp. NPDC059786]|uniref:hypothetical protein n=1 Tax=Streptomyces sp. NPDC059786 TaxID=3346946 RepID=UPI003664B32F
MMQNRHRITGGTMNTRAAIAAIALLTAALTACSSTDDDKGTPKPSATATTSAPAADPAQARQACADAVQDAIDADPGNDDLERPDECAELSESDYLDAYTAGLEAHNKAGRDALQDSIDEASKAAEDQ